MVLEIKELRHQYASGFTLGPISLSVAAHDCIGILGKNGAGKSTFFRLLTGNLDVESGEARFLNQKINPEAFLIRRQIGYLPQDLELPKWVTALELLRYAAALHQLPNSNDRVAEALHYWDCEFFKDRPLGTCSYGMKKRVGLALAMLHNPQLLIIDEPFSGLDIFHVRALVEKIAARRKGDGATILSTHTPHYAAQLCDQIFIFLDGAVCTLDGWRTKDQSKRVIAIEEFFFK